MLDLSITKINGELGHYGSDVTAQSWEMQGIYSPLGHGAMAAGLPWAIPALYAASAQETLPSIATWIKTSMKLWLKLKWIFNPFLSRACINKGAPGSALLSSWE